MCSKNGQFDSIYYLIFCFRQQHGGGSGSGRRQMSPGPMSDSDDSDISLGGTSPPSPSSTPPPSLHQQSPVSSLNSIGPIRTAPLNFRYDPISPFNFGPATAFKFPSAGFRFGPHSPQYNHHNLPTGGIFRLAETSPFQAVGPRDLGSRLVYFFNFFYVF